MHLLFLALFLPATIFSATTYDVQVGFDNAPKYFPDMVALAPGDTVRFRFASGNHSVTQESAAAKCQKDAMASFDFRQPVDTTAEFTFMKEGSYLYYSSSGDDCAKGMRGTVVVKGNGTTNDTKLPSKNTTDSSNRTNSSTPIKKENKTTAPSNEVPSAAAATEGLTMLFTLSLAAIMHF